MSETSDPLTQRMGGTGGHQPGASGWEGTAYRLAKLGWLLHGAGAINYYARIPGINQVAPEKWLYDQPTYGKPKYRIGTLPHHE
jgi:hypothetical protein